MAVCPLLCQGPGMKPRRHTRSSAPLSCAVLGRRPRRSAGLSRCSEGSKLRLVAALSRESGFFYPVCKKALHTPSRGACLLRVRAELGGGSAELAQRG